MASRPGAARDGALLLQSWFSPAFPTGGFAYSHGMESAIADRRLGTAADCRHWLMAILEHGSLWNDAVLFGATWRAVRDADRDTVAELNDLALALSAGAERLVESTGQADGFQRAVSAWQAGEIDPTGASRERPYIEPVPGMAFPVVAAICCAARAELQLAATLSAWCLSIVSNLVWICVRLVPLGQSDGLRLVASLMAPCEGVAHRAATGTLAAIGGCTPMADLAALQHEQLPGRVCIS